MRMCTRGETEVPVYAGPSGEQARTDATPSRMEKPVEVMGFELGKEVMDTLRQRHPHISGILEVFLQELGVLAFHCSKRQNMMPHVPAQVSSNIGLHKYEVISRFLISRRLC